MALYKNIDDDTDKTYEFSLICDAILDANPDIRKNRFSNKLAHCLVCEALDFVWGIARKRINVNAKYEYDVVLRITRERLDRRTMPGMSDYLAEAENWFRWEDDGLVLVNWLCRNLISESEAEKRRISAEKERKERIDSEKEEKRKESNRLRQREYRSKKSSLEQDAPVTCDTTVVSHACHTLVTCDVTSLSQHDSQHDIDNNNNNNIQKHVSCPDILSGTPISGSEALESTRRFIQEIPLCEPPSAVCAPHAFRDLITYYFDHDTHGNAVGLMNLPSGAQKYLERLYIDLSPYPPDVIRTAIESELKRPMNPENPNDGMIIQAM